MKKEMGIFFILCLCGFSCSFVSAGWFGDFWGKITGEVVASLGDEGDVCVYSDWSYWSVEFDGKQDCIDYYENILSSSSSTGTEHDFLYYSDGVCKIRTKRWGEVQADGDCEYLNTYSKSVYNSNLGEGDVCVYSDWNYWVARVSSEQDCIDYYERIASSSSSTGTEHDFLYYSDGVCKIRTKRWGEVQADGTCKYLDSYPDDIFFKDIFNFNLDIGDACIVQDEKMDYYVDDEQDCVDYYDGLLSSLGVRVNYDFLYYDAEESLCAVGLESWGVMQKNSVCVFEEEQVCTSKDYYSCYDGDVWWYDSCDERYALKQSCDYGCSGSSCDEQVCTSKDYYSCYDGDVWWYDSCGELGTRKESCDYGCSGSSCNKRVCVDDVDSYCVYDFGYVYSDTDGYLDSEEEALEGVKGDFNEEYVSYGCSFVNDFDLEWVESSSWGWWALVSMDSFECPGRVDCDGECVLCADSEWAPSVDTVCEGDIFEQTSSCGSREVVGNMSCEDRVTCYDDDDCDSDSPYCNLKDLSCYECSDGFSYFNCGSEVCAYGGTSAGRCVECVDEVWSPSEDEYCEGEDFIQVSNCGTERDAVGTNSCEEDLGGNRKNMDFYSDGQVFLVSDSDWHDVLPFVSTTVWTRQLGDPSSCVEGYGTADGVCVYPMLIFHEESEAFDADSIIYFMQQYDADEVRVVGESPVELDELLVAERDFGAGVDEGSVKRVGVDDYLLFWESFEDVVLVEDDYASALIASTYASLLNVPLVVEGSVNDVDEVFEGRNVICVGDVGDSSVCDVSYSVEELRGEYVEETGTDKVVLVNSEDLGIVYQEEFQPDRSAGLVNEIYSKASLASPFLASAKHELIFDVVVSDYLEVDSLLEGVIDNLFDEAKYLTIVASPNAIDMSVVDAAGNYDEVDNSIYGSSEVGKVDLGVGRIFGVTISDVTSNIARSLFYNSLDVSDDAVSVIYERHSGIDNDEEACLEFASDNYFGEELKGEFSNAYEYGGSGTEKHIETIMAQLSDSLLFIYNDHGSYNKWSYYLEDGNNDYLEYSVEYPLMKPNLILNEACLTCAFDKILKWHFKIISEQYISGFNPISLQDIDDVYLEVEVGKVGNFESSVNEEVTFSISSDGENWIECGSFVHEEYPSYNLVFDCGLFSGDSVYIDIDVEGGDKSDYYSFVDFRDASSGETLIFVEATNRILDSWYYSSNLLCLKMIRNGAVVFHGATDSTYGNGEELGYLTDGIVIEGKSVGESIKDLRNNYNGYYPSELIIGDPTFKI